MTVDAHKNFAYSLVATAPSPATSGTSLVVTAGQGALFPAVPFNATIWPTAAQPLATTAEIVRVTGISTDTLTITRTQEGFGPRTVVVGDQIAAAITAKTLTDVEQGALTGSPLIVARQSNSAARNSGNTGTTLTADDTLLFPVSGNSTDVLFFEAFLLFNAASLTMDAKVGFTVPSGTTMTWGYGFVAGSSGFPGSPATATSYSVSAALTQSTNAAYAVAAPAFASANGFVYVGGTSGNVTLTWAQNASEAGNLILNAGSFLRLTRLV